MTLPDKDTLKSIYDSHAPGLPTDGWFWSSSQIPGSEGDAYIVYFGDGGLLSGIRDDSGYEVLCVGE